MRTTTCRSFEFNASHSMAHNGNGGTPHLHAYTVSVEVAGDASGLDEAWRGIVALIENADLDAELVKPRHMPSSSAEDLCAFLFGEFSGALDDDDRTTVEVVTVHDTPNTWAVAVRA